MKNSIDIILSSLDNLITEHTRLHGDVEILTQIKQQLAKVRELNKNAGSYLDNGNVTALIAWNDDEIGHISFYQDYEHERMLEALTLVRRNYASWSLTSDVNDLISIRKQFSDDSKTFK